MKKEINGILFYIAYISFISAMMLKGIIGFDNIEKLLQLICAMCLVAHIVTTSKFNKKTFSILGFIFIICIITAYISKEYIVLVLFGFVMAGKDINFRKIIKLDLFIRSFLLIVVITLYKLNLTEVVVAYKAGKARYALGFVHPNAFGGHVFALCIDIFYLYFKKFNIIHYGVCFIMFYLIDSISNSQTALIGIAVMLILYSIYKYHNGILLKLKVSKITIYNFFIICAGISFLIAYSYGEGNAYAIKLNNLITTRFSWIYTCFMNYKLEFFGQYIYGKEIIDNTYTYILFNYGILSFIIFAIVFLKTFKKLYLFENYSAIIILLTYVIVGITEMNLIKIHFNVFLLCISVLLNNKSFDERTSNNEKIEDIKKEVV